MGNRLTIGRRPPAGTVLFFLCRTWTVIVKERGTRSVATPDDNSTVCQCPQCRRDDDDDDDSELFSSVVSMAPNSDDSINRFHHFLDDNAFNGKPDKQRPPIYNPEDYASALRKWARKPINGSTPPLYTNQIVEMTDRTANRSHSFRDYRHPMVNGSEMTLKQFSTVTELLAKLKLDLRLAYPSFVQEFVADPLDGVSLLLDLLRAIQLSQSTVAPGSNATAGKVPPALQRRALLDELSCLQCLLSCTTRYSEATRRMAASSAGLFTLAICIMSNVNKSRILALQLLTKTCQLPPNGHSAISEAMSTLRLRFGEPTRFRFLVGMLLSAGSQAELLAAGLKFINTLLRTCKTTQKRLYIQAELEQAGFDVLAIRKNLPPNANGSEQVYDELNQWDKQLIDIEMMVVRLNDAEHENDSLKDKIRLLERKIQILQEEKTVLISLEQCLKERCSELQGEVHSLKSSTDPIKRNDEKHEDEGISSSERSLTPEELQRETSVYETYKLHAEKVQVKVNNEERETTIEDVMAEFKNIVDDVEEKERKRIEEAQVESKKRRTYLEIDDFALTSAKENEIVPAELHPQPPRRAKSLIHLFVPSEDYEYAPRELFFENETAYSSDDSDSLLSASKNANATECRPLPVGSSNIHTSLIYRTEDKLKSKSLDRIDDGLDAMVDIVVTSDTKKHSDSGNATTVSLLSRSVSHCRKVDDKRILRQKPEEVSYYFPRVHEKRRLASSFLIKRGHTNAGMYTGQGITRNSSKVTDLASGLY